MIKFLLTAVVTDMICALLKISFSDISRWLRSRDRVEIGCYVFPPWFGALLVSKEVFSPCAMNFSGEKVTDFTASCLFELDSLQCSVH